MTTSNVRMRLADAPLGFGTMAVGGQYADIDDASAHATLLHAFASGLRLFDTAPQYGCGLAEERLGRALATWPRDAVVIASKVGKRIVPLGSGGQRQRTIFFPGGHDAEMVFDYSADGTKRIIEDSLRRLRTDRLDLALIHDVIRVFHGEEGVHARYVEARDGALVALRKLQAEGVVGAVGIGLKDVDIALRFVVEAGIDVVLVPGRMTLLDQSAATSGLLDACVRTATAVIAAAPFDSGILVTGSAGAGTYGYKPPDAAILSRVREIEAICAQHDVPLPALALQFPRRHPAIGAVLCGMRSVSDVAQNIAWSQHRVPNAVWTELAHLHASGGHA